MLTGFGSLGACWVFMIRAAECLARAGGFDPSLLAAIHLFVIGYGMIVVHRVMLNGSRRLQGRLY